MSANGRDFSILIKRAFIKEAYPVRVQQFLPLNIHETIQGKAPTKLANMTGIVMHPIEVI